MGGKSSGSAAPIQGYQALADSNTQIASMEQQNARESLQFSKDQFQDFKDNFQPALTESMNSDLNMQNLQDSWAATDRSRYDQNYYPEEQKFLGIADNYNTTARQNQNAGAAMADVASQYDQARASATANLESYGIDPSQTRFGALDLGTRVSQAAASASAGTQARQQTEATGISLLGQAINTGRGYANSSAQFASGGTQAGSGSNSGVNSNTQAASSYGNMMGSPTQWSGALNQTQGVTASALTGMGNYELGNANMKNEANASTWKTGLSAVGTVVGAAAAM